MCRKVRIGAQRACGTAELKYTNLELGVALEEKNVDNVQLADVAVLLEFLTDLCADGGDGDVQRVHCLDLGGLNSDE